MLQNTTSKAAASKRPASLAGTLLQHLSLNNRQKKGFRKLGARNAGHVYDLVNGPGFDNCPKWLVIPGRLALSKLGLKTNFDTGDVYGLIEHRTRLALEADLEAKISENYASLMGELTAKHLAIQRRNEGTILGYEAALNEVQRRNKLLKDALRKASTHLGMFETEISPETAKTWVVAHLAARQNEEHLQKVIDAIFFLSGLPTLGRIRLCVGPKVLSAAIALYEENSPSYVKAHGAFVVRKDEQVIPPHDGKPISLSISFRFDRSKKPGYPALMKGFVEFGGITETALKQMLKRPESQDQGQQRQQPQS